jgi:hypothetical protein
VKRFQQKLLIVTEFLVLLAVFGKKILSTLPTGDYLAGLADLEHGHEKVYMGLNGLNEEKSQMTSTW